MSGAGAAASGAGSSAAVSVPPERVLHLAAEIAIKEDKAILLDYYNDTRNGTAFLGEDKETKERVLIKSPDEYTSTVKRICKALTEYIIVTENSVYIVSGQIQKKEIKGSSL